MRLSELLGSPVLDERGRRVGRVQDVRVRVVDAPAVGVERVEVVGLLLNLGAIRNRLGYNRREERAPWLVRAPLRLLARRSRYVPWECVRSVEGDGVRVLGTSDGYGRPPVLSD